MYELSGSINGKNYDKQSVSAEQLNDIFNLGLSKKGYITISDMKKRAEPKIFQTSPVIRGLFDGSQVEVRYFTSKTVKEKVTNYVPVRMIHNTGDYKISLEKNFEIAVFYALSPRTKGSPIQAPGTTYRFYVRDKMKEAQEELDKITKIDAIKAQLYTMGEEDLRVIARGLVLSGFNIPGDKNTSVQEIKLALIKAATNFPRQFASQFEDQGIAFRGLVKRALDLNIIVQRKKDIAKTPYFMFEQTNEFICDVPAESANYEDYLVSYMGNANRMMEYKDKIIGLIQQSKMSKDMASVPIESFRIEDDVTTAINKGLIKFDAVEMKVKDKNDNTLANVEGEDWVESFREKLNVPVIKGKFSKLLKDG